MDSNLGTEIDYNIPFCSNTEDDTHCFQAALKMVMKYFWPDKDYSWEDLEIITKKVEGLWTWPMAGLLWLAEQRVEVIDIEVFDYNRFIAKGGKYLIDEYGKEVLVHFTQMHCVNWLGDKEFPLHPDL